MDSTHFHRTEAIPNVETAIARARSLPILRLQSLYQHQRHLPRMRNADSRRNPGKAEGRGATMSKPSQTRRILKWAGLFTAGCLAAITATSCGHFKGKVICYSGMSWEVALVESVVSLGPRMYRPAPSPTGFCVFRFGRFRYSKPWNPSVWERIKSNLSTCTLLGISGNSSGTFQTSLVYPLVPIVAFTLLFFWLDRPCRLPEQCTSCRYNLTANTSGICPECGTPIPKEVQEKLPTGFPTSNAKIDMGAPSFLKRMGGE